MSADTILDYWEPDEEPTKLLRYFYFDAEAQMAALSLRRASIPSFITSSNSQVMLPTGQGWIGLHIRERDFEQAVAVLKAAEMWDDEHSSSVDLSWRWVLGALLLILVGFLGKFLLSVE